jgi:hypothetical protein
MSRVVLTSSRQLSLGGAAATVMGPSRARAPSGVSQTDWDDNTALQMIFDGFETTAELQQELQDLKGVKLLQRFIHGLLSNERGRLCDVLDEVAQEAGLYQQGDDGRTPDRDTASSMQQANDLQASPGLTVHGRRTTAGGVSLQERINRGEVSLLDDVDCLAEEEIPAHFEEQPDQDAGDEQTSNP